jgi:type IV secretion system protein VirB10
VQATPVVDAPGSTQFALGTPPAADRRLDGPVFQSTAPAVPSAIPSSMGTVTANGSPSTAPGDGGIESLLKPVVATAVRAKVLSNQPLLLPKGAFIDCTLETAIDSSLPGLTTCITATDTFGADGKVVLLERGTKLVGETKGDVRQGTARIFVVWSEARTPSGVVVPLASPGTDELGRSGLAGSVDRHFMDRFGAALLVSVIEGAVQAVAQPKAGERLSTTPRLQQM